MNLERYMEILGWLQQGKEVQCLVDSAPEVWSAPVNWLHVNKNLPGSYYRIKPDAVRVPLGPDDIPSVCWVRFVPGGPARMINVVGYDFIQVSCDFGQDEKHTYKSLMDSGYQYSADRKNWKPFHKTDTE